MKIVKCPECGGPQLLPNGKICKNCSRGMVVMCSECNIKAMEKGGIPVSQLPECKSVEIINSYSSNWSEL